MSSFKTSDVTNEQQKVNLGIYFSFYDGVFKDNNIAATFSIDFPTKRNFLIPLVSGLGHITLKQGEFSFELIEQNSHIYIP